MLSIALVGSRLDFARLLKLSLGSGFSHVTFLSMDTFWISVRSFVRKRESGRREEEKSKPRRQLNQVQVKWSVEPVVKAASHHESQYWKLEVDRFDSSSP